MFGNLLLSFQILTVDHFMVQINMDVPRDRFGFENKFFSFPVIFSPRFLSRSIVERKWFLVLKCNRHGVFLHLLTPRIICFHNFLVERFLHMLRYILRSKFKFQQFIFLLLLLVNHLLKFFLSYRERTVFFTWVKLIRLRGSNAVIIITWFVLGTKIECLIIS